MSHKNNNIKRIIPQYSNALIFLTYLLLIMMAIIALTFGRYPMPVKDLIVVIKAGLSHNLTKEQSLLLQILFDIRLPRILAAIVTGSCLSAAGASIQGTFRNPMASPGLLGVSSGAAFGAAFAILLQLNTYNIQLFSFIFGIGTVLLVYGLSKLVNKTHVSSITLILIGIVISSLFTSLISFLKYVADPYDTLPAITFWLMGSLSNVALKDLMAISLPIIIGLATLIFLRWKITVLSFGEEEATAIGLNYQRTQFIVVFASTLITASVVSISGLIGFVGLVVPHMARLIIGPNYNKLLPLSISLGGIYLLIIDTISRSLFSAEIPLGILTSIIGTPFFIILFIQTQKSKYSD